MGANGRSADGPWRCSAQGATVAEWRDVTVAATPLPVAPCSPIHRRLNTRQQGRREAEAAATVEEQGCRSVAAGRPLSPRTQTTPSSYRLYRSYRSLRSSYRLSSYRSSAQLGGLRSAARPQWQRQATQSTLLRDHCNMPVSLACNRPRRVRERATHLRIPYLAEAVAGPRLGGGGRTGERIALTARCLPHARHALLTRGLGVRAVAVGLLHADGATVELLAAGAGARGGWKS